MQMVRLNIYQHLEDCQNILVKYEPKLLGAVLYVTLCAIWCHINNLKNVKDTHEGVLLLIKLQAEAYNFSKVALLHGCFFHVFNIVLVVASRAKCLISKRVTS